MYWMLAREVMYLRGVMPRTDPWEVMVDSFFWRDPEELLQREEEEKARAEAAWQEENKPETAAAQKTDDWGTSDWAAAAPGDDWGTAAAGDSGW